MAAIAAVECGAALRDGGAAMRQLIDPETGLFPPLPDGKTPRLVEGLWEVGAQDNTPLKDGGPSDAASVLSPLTPSSCKSDPKAPVLALAVGTGDRPSSSGGGSSDTAPMLSRDATGAGFFFCSKCSLNKPVGELVSRGGQSTCNICVSAYSSLANRWRTCRELKVWFQAKKPEEKTAWYRKQGSSHTAGKKRTYEELTAFQRSESKAIDQSEIIDEWIPFTAYARRRALDGVSRPTAIAEFRQIVLRGDGKWVREQWHVYEYGGFKERRVQQRSATFTVAQSTGVSGAEQLEELLSGAAKLQANFMANIDGRASHNPALQSSDAPVVPRKDGADFSLGPAVEPLLHLMRGEVF